MLPLPAGGGKGRKQLPGEGIGGARGLALKRKAAKEKEKAPGGKRRRDESGNAEVPAPLRRPSTRSYARDQCTQQDPAFRQPAIAQWPFREHSTTAGSKL